MKRVCASLLAALIGLAGLGGCSGDPGASVPKSDKSKLEEQKPVSTTIPVK